MKINTTFLILCCLMVCHCKQAANKGRIKASENGGTHLTSQGIIEAGKMLEWPNIGHGDIAEQAKQTLIIHLKNIDSVMNTATARQKKELIATKNTVSLYLSVYGALVALFENLHSSKDIRSKAYPFFDAVLSGVKIYSPQFHGPEIDSDAKGFAVSMIMSDLNAIQTTTIDSASLAIINSDIASYAAIIKKLYETTQSLHQELAGSGKKPENEEMNRQIKNNRKVRQIFLDARLAYARIVGSEIKKSLLSIKFVQDTGLIPFPDEIDGQLLDYIKDPVNNRIFYSFRFIFQGTGENRIVPVTVTANDIKVAQEDIVHDLTELQSVISKTNDINSLMKLDPLLYGVIIAHKYTKNINDAVSSLSLGVSSLADSLIRTQVAINSMSISNTALLLAGFTPFLVRGIAFLVAREAAKRSVAVFGERYLTGMAMAGLFSIPAELQSLSSEEDYYNNLKSIRILSGDVSSMPSISESLARIKRDMYFAVGSGILGVADAALITKKLITSFRLGSEENLGHDITDLLNSLGENKINCSSL